MHSTLLLGLVGAAAALPATTANLPSGVFSIPLQRIKNQTAYGATAEVGTPPQKNVLLVDTGSATIGMESRLNYVCSKGLCKDYGMYNNNTSSSSKYISAGYFDMVGDRGSGSFYNDTVSFGGKTLKNFYFGTIDSYDGGYVITEPQAGFFGLGAVCRTKECNSYPSVIQQLYDRGIISRRAFSVYLGPNTPDAKGNILIGGIDKAKRQGPVYKLKARNPLDLDANGQPNFSSVKSVQLRDANGKPVKSHKFGKDDYTIWDTGSPRMYLPEEIFDAVIKRFGLTKTPDQGPLTVDCKHYKPTKESLVVAIDKDASIEIPLNHLVVQVRPDHCEAHIGLGGISFGDSFLREVYVTFDYDTLTFEYAAVKHTDATDIVKIQ